MLPRYLFALSTSTLSLPHNSHSLRLLKRHRAQPLKMDDDQLIQQWELEVRDIDDRFICHLSQQRWSSDERWERLEMLGRGGYGEVWLQKCTTGPRVGDLRAVKEIPKDVTKASEDGHAKIRHQELSALIKFSHQQVRPSGPI
jgi:hypothetical protein